MKNLWIFLFLLGVVGSVIAHEKTAPSAAGNETDFCDDGRKCVDLSSCAALTEQLRVPAQVTLVLGNSGCGKSTLVKFLIGENMRSVGQHNEFVIQGQGIGNDVKSHTKVPELMVDVETGSKFYDCPGFEDSRGSCAEITTTFYMKDITRHAEKVKVLLLTPHYAIKWGAEDRSEFVTMLMHAARILKVTEKFEGSVGLVVTKVRAFKRVGGVYVLLPDDSVRKDVVAYLRDLMLPFLEEEAANPEQEIEVVESAKAIVRFLIKSPELIGIFRAPDEEGPVGEIELMTTGRQVLRTMVFDKLRYADVQPQYFGFSVSARTKLFMMQRARQLVDVVDAKLSTLTRQIVDAGTRESYDPADIVGTVKRFDETIATQKRVTDDLQKSTSVRDFSIRLAKDMSGTPQEALAVNLAIEFNNLDVAQVVSEKSLLDDKAVAQWSRALGQASEALGKHRNWNRLLVSLYERLSQRDVQASLGHYASSLKPLGAGNVTAQSLDAFLDAALELGLIIDPQPSKLYSKDSNLTDLNRLVERVLLRGLQFECLPGGRLVITGESVLLSEAVAKARSSPCPFDVRHIEVYALNSVFVDGDVLLPGGSLFVAAPRWQVVGERRISLDGADGAAWGPVATTACCGNHGVNGKAGRPGSAGGIFLGIGAEIAGGPRLLASVNGGRGGDGQRGGAGSDGKDGGGDGGKGGDGGVGGLGGRHGKVEFWVGRLHEGLKVQTAEQDGVRGAVGAGGRGGVSVPHGGARRRSRRDFSVAQVVLGGAALLFNMFGKKNRSPPPPPPVYQNGLQGADGTSTGGLEQPANPQPVQWDRATDQLQTYLRRNLDHPYRRVALSQFLDIVCGKNETLVISGGGQLERAHGRIA